MQKADIERALAPLAALTELAKHNVNVPDPIFEMGLNVNGEGKNIRLTMEDAARAQIALDYLKGLDESKRPQPGPEHDPNEAVTELPPLPPREIHETKQQPMPPATETTVVEDVAEAEVKSSNG